jgi:uncharacterized protein YjgD (DUF1641 family)
MDEGHEPLLQGLTAQERAALEGVLRRVAQSAPAIEQLLDVTDRLAESGVLAGVLGLLEEFEHTFRAMTRPELMGMVANLMMLLGVLSQVTYEPFFSMAMNAPPALNEGYAHLKERRKGLTLREVREIARSPEVAAALRTLIAVLRVQRQGVGPRRASGGGHPNGALRLGPQPPIFIKTSPVPPGPSSGGSGPGPGPSPGGGRRRHRRGRRRWSPAPGPPRSPCPAPAGGRSW